MEEKALECLKGMLTSRQIKVEKPDIIGNPLEETRMFNMGGVLIIFSEKGRLTEGVLNSYITFASENGHTHGVIIVSLSQPSESILGLVRAHNAIKENPLLQIFDIRRLQFDITTHRKVPPHRILSEDEVKKLEVRMNILDSKAQLPWIDSQDPMAKWIGARMGDIIEIIRFSESAGATPYYRYCANNVLET
jgi:DNA-directed RNA polymerase I, II, and III subunit RPABC1